MYISMLQIFMVSALIAIVVFVQCVASLCAVDKTWKISYNLPISYTITHIHVRSRIVTAHVIFLLHTKLTASL